MTSYIENIKFLKRSMLESEETKLQSRVCTEKNSSYSFLSILILIVYVTLWVYIQTYYYTEDYDRLWEYNNFQNKLNNFIRVIIW